MQSEGAADEARKEGSGGDTHSMIGTQEAVARVCGTKTNGTEPTNDSGYVEQVRVDNACGKTGSGIGGCWHGETGG